MLNTQFLQIIKATLLLNVAFYITTYRNFYQNWGYKHRSFLLLSRSVTNSKPSPILPNQKDAQPPLIHKGFWASCISTIFCVIASEQQTCKEEKSCKHILPFSSVLW